MTARVIFRLVYTGQQITHVTPSYETELQTVANAVGMSQRIIVATGAGISTSAGVPDFRSHKRFVKTREIFYETALSHPSDGPVLVKLCTELFKAAKASLPTETHRFINELNAKGRLVRHYTQNIDCLEDKAGLSTDLRLGPGGYRVRGVECVPLHGSLRSLRCVSCRQSCSWDEREAITSAGKLPTFPACPKTTVRGRQIRPGLLRPDILLYGELDPRADSISKVIRYDLSLDLDLLLILGTSLQVHVFRKLMKQFAKVVYKNKGLVLFINRGT
ncbi:DHS-like NAD/FAD-binding domain-containing protein [Xylaria arbuscula]|nr:DHS-like NAD/FAD-binding domain-containing protein [Xylaria arbuscula]